MHVDESPAAELWRRTLSQIPAVFGRLVYLSSLRDSNTDLYQHYGFAQRYTDREADKTMRRSHINAFADWLCMSIEDQKDDVDRYIAGLPGAKCAIVANWVRFPPFAALIPIQTRTAERELFLMDMQVILEVLKRDCSGA